MAIGTGVGVDRRGGGARIFPHLRCDVGRQRDEEIRRLVGKDVAHEAFVGGVLIGVEQADGHRLHAELLAARRATPRTASVSTSLTMLPSAQRALGHREGQFVRHQRLRQLRSALIVNIRSGVRRGCRARRGSPSVTSRAIGGALRSMSALVTIVVACTTTSSTCSALAIARACNTGSMAAKKPSSRSSVCGQRLVDPEIARHEAQHHVGKGSADIDGNRIIRHATSNPVFARYVVPPPSPL